MPVQPDDIITLESFINKELHSKADTAMRVHLGSPETTENECWQRCSVRICNISPPPSVNSGGNDWWKFIWLLPKGDMVHDMQGNEWHVPNLIYPKQQGATHLTSDQYADLEQCEILPAWIARARKIWSRFARKADTSLYALLSLEAALNALWTEPVQRAQVKAHIMPPHANALLTEETKHTVHINTFIRGNGNPRLPHPSHINTLCLFQTPESKDIGTSLFRAAANGNLKDDPEGMFSLGVGLLPYVQHTDGPRLMMGGKNLKQAEQHIQHAEKARVAGVLECAYPFGKKGLDIKEGRFSANLGVNALVALMPYEGLTYEDGLVVSAEFAQKLRIPESPHRIKCIRQVWLPKTEKQQLPTTAEKNYSAFTCPSFRLDDPLPLDILPLSVARHITPSPRYDSRARGRLHSVHLQSTMVRKAYSSKQEGRKDEAKTLCTVTLIYTFTVDRPLQVGDKLTGRHGNKGIVTHILPEPARVRVGNAWHNVDVFLSPCSIMGRKNLGQLYEMAHSLLQEAHRQGVDMSYADINGDLFKIKGIAQLSAQEMKKCLPILQQLQGGEEGFLLDVPLPSGQRVQCRAFAGWQYMVRLHHHAENKLQARGQHGPCNTLLSQPSSGGAHAGQRLGEMENWAILGYAFANTQGKSQSLDFLLDLRGDAPRTTEHAQNIFAMLGLQLEQNAHGACLRPLLSDDAKLWPENTLNQLLRDVQAVRESIQDGKEILGKTFFCPDINEQLQDVYTQLSATLDAVPDSPKVSRLHARYQQALKGCFIERMNASGVVQRGLCVNTSVLYVHDSIYKNLVRAVRAFAEALKHTHKIHSIDCCKAFIKYHTSIMSLLQGKTGLLRYHMTGRRCNFSGRAVIVPDPSLPLDTIDVPLDMFLDILEHSDRADMLNAIAIKPLLAQRHDAEPQCRTFLVQGINAALAVAPVWTLFIRQPALHRHSVQAWKIRVWDKHVIGMPPLATAGYNADFDGDTMALFLPPSPYSHDLRALSLISNPGLIGTGAPALADGLDLAAGWMALPTEEQKLWLKKADLPQGTTPRLGPLLRALIKAYAHDTDRLAQELGILQQDICKASTGALTLCPEHFASLAAHLHEGREALRLTAQTDEAMPHVLQQHKRTAEAQIELWLTANENLGLARMVRHHIKGTKRALCDMCGFLGYQQEWHEAFQHMDAYASSGACTIDAGFWHGLSFPQMQIYSYATRQGMISKKLGVAEAGFFSRQLAEGLFNLRIGATACNSQRGLSISFANGRCQVGFDPEGSDAVPFLGTAKNPDELTHTLTRLAWGRVPLGQSRPLTHADITSLANFWMEGKGTPPTFLQQRESLVLYSPLTCTMPENRVCALCVGADVSSMPFPTPVLYPVESHIGLVAAQALGERGTQLSMKKFHETNTGKQIDVLALLRSLLIGASPQRSRKSLLLELVANALQDGEKARKELPQQCIYFELALRPPHGLFKAAQPEDFVAALSHGYVARQLQTLSSPRHDGLQHSKSRLVMGSTNTVDKGGKA